ncbi:hypothetical protein GCM10027048_08260 [Hymenobacter coalescens]
MLLALLPFVALSFYSHPALDDFSDAVLRQRLGFWATQKHLYLTWTGRFTTSVLLTEFSPVCNRLLGVYWAVPIVALLALFGGLYALLATVIGRFWTPTKRALGAGCLLTLWLHQASSIAETLYWYNGVAVYTLPAALLLLWLATAVCYWQAAPGRGPAHRWLLLLVALGMLLVGTNELIALPLCLGTGLLMLREYYRGGNRRGELLLLVMALAAALAVSFLAPGNMARATMINRSVPLPWVVAGSVSSSAYLLLNWLSSGVLQTTTLLALPALLRLTAARPGILSRLSTWHPLLLGAVLLLMLVLAGMPSYWATGGLMPPRGRSMLYLFFILAWFGLILNALARWQTAVVHYLQGPLLSGLGWAPPAAAVLWAALLISLAADHNVRQLRPQMGQGSNNIVVAYRDWLSGDAGVYDAQLRSRYVQLRSSDASRVELPPLQAKPASLLYYDISTDPAYWGNMAYAHYFGKQAVWIGPGGQAPPQ